MASESTNFRQSLRYFRIAATAFVVLVAGTATFTILFHPFDVVTFWVFWLLWIAAVPFWVVLARKLPRRAASTAALVVWLVCASLAGSELALRIVSWTNPSPLFARLDGSLEDRLRAFKVSGPYFQGFPINSQGWNDEELHDKAPGMVRVVSISDSFAWGATPHYYHFSTVWERHAPGIEVVNLGYPGTGLDAYLYILKYYALSLDPDLIVINIFVGNDIVPPPVGADPGFLRRWFDRDNLMTYTVAFRVIKLATENVRKKQSPISVDIEGNSHRPVVNLTRSRDGVPLLVLGPNWQIAGNLQKVEDDKLTQAFPWLNDPQLEQATYSRKTYLEMAAKKARNICHLIGQEASWRPLFADYVEKIIAAAGDTPVAFVLIPDEIQVEDELWRQIQLSSSVALDRNLAQRQLRAWFDEHDVEYLDLLPHFNSVPVMGDGRRHFYHRQDTHLNRRGNELVGQTLAQWFSKSLNRPEQ